ncbi:hypothetical protein [Streptomyces torulosus]|uniref:hypothetical protein n=1 Tax=Streptomyces torulosus TaxID=68276 RepID=UPI0006EB50B3
MPQPLPDRPDFFTCHRALPEQAVAATVARGHRTPYPASPSKSAYGEDAAKAGKVAFRESLGGHVELPRTVRASAPVEHPEYPEAVRRTPLVARLDATADRETGVFVNQSAAFGDFHGSAAGPAAGATLSDPAFVTGDAAVAPARSLRGVRPCLTMSS